MEEFRRIREKIDTIIDETKLLVLNETITDSTPGIENANKLLLELEKRASGDIQARIVAKRVLALQVLAKSINAVLVKKARKKVKPRVPKAAPSK
jgi:hypothetical protein